MPSLLLNKCRSAPHESPGLVRSWAVEDLGKAAEATEDDWDAALAGSAACSKLSQSPGGREWLAALAREWLLRMTLQGGSQITVPPALASIEPFPEDLPNQPLACLAGRPWAAAMFLLDSVHPATGVVYVCQEKAVRIASAPSLSIEGESWHLSRALARAALAELGQGRANLARDLLRNWVATGLVKGQRVERVLIGSKLEAPQLQQRRIIVPEANQADLAPYLLKPIARRIHTCTDVLGAIGLIDGTRPEDGNDLKWPENVEVMHALVGGSYKACLAPILLLRPKRLVLWVSDGPGIRETATAIQNACKNGLGRALGLDEAPKTESISSKRLQEAWNRLAAGGLNHDLNSPETVYFNITSGNRLMSMATLPFIQIHPKLVAVYRDIDAETLDLTFLRFRGLRALEKPIKAPWAGEAPKVIHWESLFDPAHPPKGTKITSEVIFKI